MQRISFIKRVDGEDLMARYSNKVCVDGFYGQVVRVIKNDNNEITHLDVEVSGVIDRYDIESLQVLKSISKNE